MYQVETESITQQDKRLEQAIVRISAKIATVIEIVQKERIVSADSLAILIQIQMKLEDLYVELGPHKKSIAKMMILR